MQSELHSETLSDKLSQDPGLPEDPDERMEAIRQRMGEERFRRAMMFHHHGGM
ncbi:MAG: hypothetical protein IKP20_03985 [Candidatus Methanomethylophilaceae archaeon]|jgi:hypothetical protein|nr:hypothetical protein [Candidatus Methanomethylophilaceae archaeon]